jgi:hypothetical protein
MHEERDASDAVSTVDQSKAATPTSAVFSLFCARSNALIRFTVLVPLPVRAATSRRLFPARRRRTTSPSQTRAGNPKFKELGERLKKVREHHEQGLLNSLDFLKTILQIAKEVVEAEPLLCNQRVTGTSLQASASAPPALFGARCPLHRLSECGLQRGSGSGMRRIFGRWGVLRQWGR